MSQTAIRRGDLVTIVDQAETKPRFGASVVTVQELLTLDDTEYALTTSGPVTAIYPLVNLLVVQTLDQRNRAANNSLR